MIKSVLFSFLLFGTMLCMMPGTASAHFLQVDGTIGGTLHVDPNDEPYVNAPATLTIDLKDTANKLILADCDCAVSIVDASGVSSANIHTVLKNSAIVAPYIFPGVGAYTIILDGKPRAVSGEFQPFHLTFSVRAEAGLAAGDVAKKSIFSGHGLHYIVFAGGIVAAAFVVLSEKKKKVI